MIDDIPTGAALSRNLGSPMAPGEAVEGELDRLIERRSRQSPPARGEPPRLVRLLRTPVRLSEGEG